MANRRIAKRRSADVRKDAADDAGERPQRGAGAPSHSAIGERLIGGVPARIMRPRLVFLASLLVILAFGLLMVYSASSVEALHEMGSSTAYLKRQALFIGVGLLAMLGVSRVRLSFLRTDAMWIIWIVLLVALIGVLALGYAAGGARRWINVGFTGLQPSEFAKSVVVVTAAKIFCEYYDRRTISSSTFLIMLGTCVGVPLILIILEPDFGTCAIIAVTVFAMCYLAGFSYRLLMPIVAVGVVVAAVFILSSSYRSARLLSDPWSDPFGDGYQATLAIMAFASGGLFGRGIGNSTMKYSYLPEAHNDYILAIIGEELGFIGMVVFLAVVVLMVYAAFTIARRAPTIQGRLIAGGCSFLIMLQFLINALGILGVMPMTGKTMPFISYGGSSMIASLVLCGLIWRVSIESNPRTVYDERREDFAVVDESTAGPPCRRSARGRAGSSPFTVVDGRGPDGGGADGIAPRPRAGAGAARDARSSRGRTRGERRTRDDGHADPVERLRGRSANRRGGYDEAIAEPRGARSKRSSRKDRYDR